MSVFFDGFGMVLRNVNDMKRTEELVEIRNILMDSGAVTCSAANFTPVYNPGHRFSYCLPNEHHITIDYNKLAKAIYDAGYRKRDNL